MEGPFSVGVRLTLRHQTHLLSDQHPPKTYVYDERNPDLTRESTSVSYLGCYFLSPRPWTLEGDAHDEGPRLFTMVHHGITFTITVLS